MRVRAHDAAHPPVEEVGHRLLLAGGLRVHVEDDRVRATLERAGGDLVVHGTERAIDLGHEHAPHGVHHQHVHAVLRLEQARAFARRALGIVERAQQLGTALDVDEGILLVERVVAERDDIGAGIDQLVEDLLGDAKAAGRVLAIDDEEIELVAGAQLGDRVVGSLAARLADDISEKQQTHTMGVHT